MMQKGAKSSLSNVTEMQEVPHRKEAASQVAQDFDIAESSEADDGFADPMEAFMRIKHSVHDDDNVGRKTDLYDIPTEEEVKAQLAVLEDSRDDGLLE